METPQSYSVAALLRPGGMRVCPAGNGKGACACLRTGFEHPALAVAPRGHTGGAGWRAYVASIGGLTMRFSILQSALVAATVAGLATSPCAASQTAARKVTSAAKREPSACAALHAEYAMAGKKLAWAKVRGDMARGAAKTRFEQESTTIMSEARLTMDLLRNNGCKAPTTAPNRDAYLGQALDCYTALMAGTGGAVRQPPACVMENWKP